MGAYGGRSCKPRAPFGTNSEEACLPSEGLDTRNPFL